MKHAGALCGGSRALERSGQVRPAGNSRVLFGDLYKGLIV